MAEEPDETEEAPEEPKPGRHRSPICEDCWPDGWPMNSGSASCAHGDWSRKVPAAERKWAGE